MKSINLDPNAFVGLLKGTHPVNKPLGFAADEHGTIYSLFVATDKETGRIVLSRDGKRIKLNLRKSLNQPDKSQAATTASAPASAGATEGEASPFDGMELPFTL